jgi:hypothetical protein
MKLHDISIWNGINKLHHILGWMPTCIGESWNELKLTFTSWFELKWGNQNFKLANEIKIQNAKKFHISVCLKIWPNYCIFFYNHHWQLMKSIGVMTFNHCHSSWKKWLNILYAIYVEVYECHSCHFCSGLVKIIIILTFMCYCEFVFTISWICIKLHRIL